MSLRQWLIAANTTRNLGRWDRAVRAALPFVVAGLYLGGAIGITAAIVLGVIAAMLFPTALTGACSVYYTLGLSTRRGRTGDDRERD
jgi:hypothetical protein